MHIRVNFGEYLSVNKGEQVCFFKKKLPLCKSLLSHCHHDALKLKERRKNVKGGRISMAQYKKYATEYKEKTKK